MRVSFKILQIHSIMLILLSSFILQDANAQCNIDSLLYYAECEDTTAQVLLGDAYLNGNGVKKNTKEAVRWLKRATKLGSSEAPRKLADYYTTCSWPYNYTKYYKIAAERGDVIAQVKLADLYMTPGNLHSKKSAAKWYLRAAENGNAEAQSNIGWMYIHGKGVNRDHEEGIKWYRKAVKNGSVSALFLLGYAYLYGYGVPADYKEAMNYYAQGAVLGNVDAIEGYLQTQLAVKSAGMPADKEYLANLHILANGGDKKSQAELGERFRLGIGVKQDFDLACKWLSKATSGDEPNVDAQLSYGMVYESNELYYRKISYMGTIYSALYFFHMAAEEGSAMAQTMIGFFYEVDEMDYDEALIWYQRAAKRGNPQAEFLIGAMYEKGKGMERDTAEARKWYGKAAAHGDMCGKMALAMLSNPKTLNNRSNGHFYVNWSTIPSPSISRSVKVTAKVVSEIEMQSCRLSVNGHSGRNAERQGGRFERTINEAVPLVGGMNNISLMVSTIDGCDTSFTQQVEYIPPTIPPNNGKEQRRALIIGNSDYSEKYLELRNARNDAHAMSDKLKKLGFEVTLIDNVKRQEMKNILVTLGDFFAGADVSLFYYAGHGMTVEEGSVSVNYLIPTDTKVVDTSLVEKACVSLEDIINKMNCGEAWKTGKLSILIIDACLDSPFTDYVKNYYRTVQAPNGMFIAYSTTRGMPASDGNDELGHSPYTYTLLQMMDRHIELMNLFDEVGKKVHEQYRQMPYFNFGGRTKVFYFDENK